MSLLKKISAMISRKLWKIGLLLFSCLITIGPSFIQANVRMQAGDPDHRVLLPLVTYKHDNRARVYLPTLRYLSPLNSSLFGVEVVSGALSRDSQVAARLTRLGGKWLRIGGLSWKTVQPQQDAPYNWSGLATMERELRAASRLYREPMLMVTHTPAWATIPLTDFNGNQFESSCAAVDRDALDEFAEFMKKAVARYKEPPFNVHYWEIGNEPDVDPRIVVPNSGFGCWGNIQDEYYGGRYYAEMLKVITPAIKSVDPQAKVIIGGLLLNSPHETRPGYGRPELFFEGILKAGEPEGTYDYFDIVAYHDYPAFNGSTILNTGADYAWAEYGGIGAGKPNFLKGTMARYGVTKPLIANEFAFRCPPSVCTVATPQFLDAQANFVPIAMSRALATGVKSILWYALNDPGWQHVGLLDRHTQPRPAYIAYREFIEHVSHSMTAPFSVNYGPGFEAYRYQSSSKMVDVVWAKNEVLQSLTVAQTQVIAVYDIKGNLLTPTAIGDNLVFDVGVNAVYIHRRP